MNKAEELIACLEGEIAKRDARIAELEGCKAGLEFDVARLREKNATFSAAWDELVAIKAQEPVAEVKRGPLDSSGWPEFVRVETIGDFDLENLPNGMKLYAAPAAPAADAGHVFYGMDGNHP